MDRGDESADIDRTPLKASAVQDGADVVAVIDDTAKFRRSIHSRNFELDSDHSYGVAPEADQRIDIIVDLKAPNARSNLNKLLHRLYADSPYLKIFVNKWHEWDDFSHKDNPMAPRAIFYPGVFQVFLERKLVKAYNAQRERRKAEEKNLSAR